MAHFFFFRSIHISTLIKKKKETQRNSNMNCGKVFANACSGRLSAEKRPISNRMQMADYIKLCDFCMESQRNCQHCSLLDHVSEYRYRIILCLVPFFSAPFGHYFASRLFAIFFLFFCCRRFSAARSSMQWDFLIKVFMDSVCCNRNLIHKASENERETHRERRGSGEQRQHQ